MQEKPINTAGLTGAIAAVESGDPAGPPVLALHGWLDNANSFRGLAGLLPGYRWISMDLPGHGLSGHRPVGCIYHFPDYVADVHRVMTALELERPIVLGHSLGAGIATLFAAAFPDRVSALVLIDGVGPFSRRGVGALAQFRKSMEHLAQEDPDRPSEYDSWDELVARRMQYGDILQSSVETLLERSSVSRGNKILVRSDQRLKRHSPLYMGQRQMLSILAGISAPTLVVLAREGLVARLPSTSKRIEAIADTRLVEVDGYHHVHMDHPERVAPHVEEFLAARLPRSADR